MFRLTQQVATNARGVVKIIERAGMQSQHRIYQNCMFLATAAEQLFQLLMHSCVIMAACQARQDLSGQ